MLHNCMVKREGSQQRKRHRAVHCLNIPYWKLSLWNMHGYRYTADHACHTAIIVLILLGLGIEHNYSSCFHNNIIMMHTSMFITLTGLISGQVVLPLAIWITIQISYTLLAVRSPFYFKRLTMNKRKGHILHIVSLLVGGISLLVPFFLVLGLGGFSLIDTIFPPIICIARNRDISAYVILIPLGILTAVIITQLILILHQLLR